MTTAEYHVGLGRHFPTVDFPGHDATAAYENFDDFTPALDAWLAAFDAVALYANGKPAEAEDRLERVRKIAAQDAGKRLVPREMFEYWPISASTFLQIGGPGTVADQFPSREGLHETTLSAIRHPTFAAVGAEDFAAYPSPHNAVAQADALPTVQAVEIPGAPHDFAGHVERLRDWDSTARRPMSEAPREDHGASARTETTAVAAR